jgi:autotransporter passenger strand-loop-strand repeat protein
MTEERIMPTVSSGQTLTVSSGQTSSDSGTLNVVAAGRIVSTDDAGVVSSGGIASGTTLTSGTQLGDGAGEFVYAGGMTSDTTMTSAGDQILSGGLAFSAGVSAQERQDVYAGGAASGTTLSGGFEVVYGTTSSATELVVAGGMASSMTASPEGAELIARTERGATASDGGQQVVSASANTFGRQFWVGAQHP